MSTLSEKKCVPCEGGMDPLTREEAQTLLEQVEGWSLSEDSLSLSKKLTFEDFAEALIFFNSVADIAEEEGHHPDICIENWNHVSIKLSTHAIKGLSENDFIMAAKIDLIRV